MVSSTIGDHLRNLIPDSYTQIDDCLTSLSIFSIAFALRVFHWFHAGYPHPRTPPDTGTYIETCSLLFSDPIRIITFTKGPSYIGFTVPFCSVYSISGQNLQLWVFFQVMLSAAACLLVYYTAAQHLNKTAGIVAGLALAISYDAFRWDIAILTETVSIFAMALALYSYTIFHANPTQQRKLAVFGVFAWLAILRPHGVPIVVAWVVSDMIVRERRGGIALFSSWKIVFVLVSLLAVIPMNAMLRGGNKSGSISGAWNNGWIIYNGYKKFIISEYKHGAVTGTDPIVFITNLPDLLVLFILRGVAFFNPVINFAYSGPGWKYLHNISLFIVIPLTLLGLSKLIKQRDINLLQLWTIPMLSILGIVVLTFLSQSFRYRAVATPVFALLVGYTVSSWWSDRCDL
ncbi:glycosyltransferase family 39 protein [Haloarcula sp. 1CSR25-25]|uniref:glycosyltransferase family 39 protein n=1 Tax=Haloarcula sp. 1CSR25-25 TaxID=2862545 RepID=UPI0028952992|nr:glycosyltransferase family 39 protein [Haloarcula sp. 1CSR25-25]MDT3434230.1 glycosyltransferase family 39 protein [Haloarcula sp. 1CSR25-25]